ncbi:MAG: septal ring lytic transglycosylase RlpA family protein [Candidatus Atribacteria bacterium]|nr:septal ring lytic transglycosylase RlpA family protein [Candidatus Atribacteria bacterium]
MREGKEVKEVTEGIASWCSNNFEGRATASGEPYNPYAFTAAHRTLPLGSVILVTNVEDGRQVVVRINDRGPWNESRVIDLSLAAAKVLDIHEDGLSEVKIEVLRWGE